MQSMSFYIVNQEGRAVTFYDPEKDSGAQKLCELLQVGESGRIHGIDAYEIG